MVSLIEEIMACIMIFVIATAIAINLKESRKENLPSGRTILESKAQKVVQQACNMVFTLLYLVLSPFLLLFGYFDRLLGWSTVSSQLVSLNAVLLLQLSGIALFIVGSAMSIAGRWTLKEYYADMWAPSKLGTDFIRTGIYSRIRHPIYSGTIIFESAIVLFFQTWFGLALLIPYFAIATEAAAKEEKFLKNRFGKKYEEYMNRTRRFLPKIRKR
jgi:protein-S-isoprenylcysteine O-methyltransferase Ste14